MNARLRPWFYTACIVVWAVVGLWPSVLTSNRESSRLQAEFYSKMEVPSLQQLSDMSDGIMTRMRKMQTWDEYGACLKDMWQVELYLGQYDGVNIWHADGETIHLTNMVRAKSSAMSHSLRQKGTELSQNRVPGRPEKGFDVERQRPPMAPMSVWWHALWTSWVFAFLVLLVRIDACEQSVWIELATPWWLVLATLLWPVGLFKYPTGDPARQLVRGLRFAAFALTAALGFMPATALAQVKKDDGGKKKSSPYTLNLDVRNTEVVGPEPNPEFLLKSTLTSPTGWIAQSTNVVRPETKFWSTANLFGHTIRNKNGVRVDALAGFSRNSAGATVIQTGAVLVVNRPRWVSAFPFIGYEHRLDKPVKDVYLVNQTVAKFGPWRAGVETYFKKVFGGPLQYYVGGVAGRTIGKKAFAEIAGYRDQTGTWRVRGRATYALSWQ